MSDMVVDAESCVVCPDGAPNLQWHPQHSLPIPGDEIEPGLGGRRKLGVRGRRTLEQQDRAHMQLLGLALDIEPPAVEGTQTVRRVHICHCGQRRASCHRP